MNLRKLGTSLKEGLDEKGFAFVHTDGLTERQFVSLGRQFGELWTPQDPIIKVHYVATPREEHNNALGRTALAPHCEGAYELEPPRYVFFHCKSSSRSGGMFYLVSMQEVLARLRPADRRALRTHAFSTRSPISGLEAERVVVSDVDGVGEVLALVLMPLTGSKTQRGLPMPFDRAGSSLLRRVGDAASDPSLRIPHRWRRGDVGVVDNARFLHGRDGFSGTGRLLWHLRIGRFQTDRARR